ncbi:polysaccharide pyruvyl transferase family protein [Faecalicatena orotica]|uniref:Pyruvyl transferase n=1 Tax=Faecalicatena orotica TaxID=1544 RepID=A0A2Y9BKE4_9FIRM|nr:polysaccharide pyruvyl transferase family protein [Faecalicatena orotica]PWJ20727.1 pyruvyl transferase [Faecalicatena orotica]SSA58526.1 pyruvyltransferase [Faecalicatena orotica]
MRADKLNLKIKKILGRRAKKVLVKMIHPWRNQFILFNWSKKAQNNHVNLDYWDETENLGDTLSPVIVNHLLALRGISPDKEVKGKKHLYAVGSVLTAGIQDATIWGSGILNASLNYRLEKRKLDVRAVRGPVTRIILMDHGYEVPEVYGDPAILLPEIYMPPKIQKQYKFGLIAHKDYDLSKVAKKNFQNKAIKTLNICTADYKTFIDELNSVEVVISSSLHGIILAESYGIHAILLEPQIDILKYSDYYYSTGRLTFPVARTIEEALTIHPTALPKMEELRSKLKAAFPYDIYD